MIGKNEVRRFAPAAGAFLLVTGGTLFALPKSGDGGDDANRLPTIVAVAPLAGGASAEQVRANIEIRQIDANSRPVGALSSASEIPDGVLVTSVVEGQQLLASSFAENKVDALGDDYVSVSVRLESQRWVGPVLISGMTVNIFEITETGASEVAKKAVVLEAPTPSDVEPKADAIVSLGIPRDALAKVLLAASENRLWLVGA